MQKISIYTDGSHFKDAKHIGLGGYCLVDGQEFRFSVNLSQQMFRTWCSTDEAVRNPTAELAAAVYALRWVMDLPAPLEVEIVADYNGVKKWAAGEWKAKKAYTQRLLELLRGYEENLKNKGITISYRHIPGHQKVDSPDKRGNDNADEMAKCMTNIENEFIQLKQ